jgi:serine/threonine protein kinase
LNHEEEILNDRVIVEFKPRPVGHNSTSKSEDYPDVRKEIRSLVRMLRLAAQKEDTFQVLYCHGFYETPENYGLVYRLPASTSLDMGHGMHCENLGNILLGHTSFKPLLSSNIQDRLDLAKSLAITMAHLHSVQWVHKSFNPDNILLFGNKIEDMIQFKWSHPYLVGFGTSRSNRGHSEKLTQCLRWENRVYVHPDRQKADYKRYLKIHDIYSLGVVLLEIGLLMCFKDRVYRNDQDWKGIMATEVQKKLLEESDKLKGIMGPTYRDIVKICLSGDFTVVDEDGEETGLGEAFRRDVCERFEQICY